MPGEFEERIAVVTGGWRGIGRPGQVDPKPRAYSQP